MDRIKFIHSADLHLDSPMTGLKNLPERIFARLQESTFQSFRRLIDLAIHYRVDFVILGGDLYDHEDRSVRAQARFRKEMERLEDAGIDVFVVFGNHDYLEGNRSHIQMPGNVHFFRNQVEVKRYITSRNTTVHLYGFSYEKRHVYERKIEEYRKKEGADFHIGILHGNLEGSVDHSPYAPFQLRELSEKGFDYWALGHIHKRAILSKEPLIIYPGNIQGRNRKENGIKGCFLIQLEEASSSYEFLETSDVIWEEVKLDASSVSNFDGLYQLCEKAIESLRREGKGVLVAITILNLNMQQKEFSNHRVEDLLEFFQEQEIDEESFVWPFAIQVKERINWTKEELVAESDFYKELFAVAEDLHPIDEILAPLYKHPGARKYLSPIKDKEAEGLLKDARNYLIGQLIQEPE